LSQGHEQLYAVRVWKAYRELAERYQRPDVPIHALHGRVRGSIHALHEFLRAESLAHRAVATSGEPAFAGDAARQSALTLPGETNRVSLGSHTFSQSLLPILLDPNQS
jgi:hypothetical protein